MYKVKFQLMLTQMAYFFIKVQIHVVMWSCDREAKEFSACGEL